MTITSIQWIDGGIIVGYLAPDPCVWHLRTEHYWRASSRNAAA